MSSPESNHVYFYITAGYGVSNIDPNRDYTFFYNENQMGSLKKYDSRQNITVLVSPTNLDNYKQEILYLCIFGNAQNDEIFHGEWGRLFPYGNPFKRQRSDPNKLAHCLALLDKTKIYKNVMVLDKQTQWSEGPVSFNHVPL